MTTEERIERLEKEIVSINEKLESLGDSHNGLAVTVAQHIGQMFTELRELLHRTENLESAVYHD